MCPCRNLYPNVYSSIIQNNSQKVETTQMPINGLMEKQIQYTNEMLFDRKKGWSTDA